MIGVIVCDKNLQYVPSSPDRSCGMIRMQRLSMAIVACVSMRANSLVAQGAPFLNINPSWSPDGKQLVFQSERIAGRTNLYIIHADGMDERRLTSTGADDTHPAWSADGKTIVFDSNRDGVWNLYT